MQDEKKTKAQLVDDVKTLRQRVALLEAAEAEHKQTAKTLEEMEMTLYRLKKAVETTGVGITITDPNGKIIYANPADAKMHGYNSVEELLGQPSNVFAPPEERKGSKPLHNEQEIFYNWERERLNMRRDGSVFPSKLISNPIYDTQRFRIGTVTVCEDITERKQTEKALRKSLQLLEKIFASLEEAVFVIDPTTRTIILSNSAVKKIFGHSEQELFGKHIKSLYADQAIYEHFDEDLFHALDAKEVFYAECQMRRKDGNLFISEHTATEIVDDSGNRTAVVNVVRDITERKNAEEELKKYHDHLEELVKERTSKLIKTNRKLQREISERKRVEEELKAYKSHLEELVEQRTAELSRTNTQLTQEIRERTQAENALKEMALFAEMHPAPILRTDLDGMITLANRAANELFEDEYLLGKSWFTLCPVVNQQDFNRLVNGEPLQHEYQICAQDFLFTYLSNPTYKLVHIYGADITALKQLEGQLLQSQKLEAIGQLAGGVAHDFNTLLGIILGYGDMMRDDLPKGNLIRDNLEEIIEAAQRAKVLIKQLMDFARPSRETHSLIHLASVIQDTLRLLRSLVPTTITIHFLNEASSDLVLANPTQIGQVLLNLGMNASDAIHVHRGEIEIILEDRNVTTVLADRHNVRPGKYVKLRVTDTGCGMKPELVKRIFEPFFTTKEVSKGSGLGLAVVHGIVKSHRGFIAVESEPGKGSTFDVYLPRIEE